MATPDPRLFELVSLLADVGADWLGFEILDGIRRGVAVEESRDSLLNAQMAARFGRRPEIEKERGLLFPIPQELHGDEQLTWAAAYVVERLRDESEMLNTGFDQLNVLAVRGQARRDRPQEPNEVAGITLQIGENGPVVETVDIAALRIDLAALNSALERWRHSNRQIFAMSCRGSRKRTGRRTSHLSSG